MLIDLIPTSELYNMGNKLIFSNINLRILFKKKVVHKRLNN